MFRKDLKEKLKLIFAAQDVRYEEPGNRAKGGDLPAGEQEVLFVEIDRAICQIKGTRPVEIARVYAKATMFGNQDKMPYGFFAKRIKQADSALTKDFFFNEIEENAGKYQNIVERTISFVFFYSGEYDPNQGTLNSVKFIEDGEIVAVAESEGEDE